MAAAWSSEQVLALGADPAALKAAKECAEPRKWVSSSAHGAVLWGEFRGSGSAPYQVKVETVEPAYHCSCPSRKFPCKHVVGLLLLWTQHPASVAPAEPPAWVTAWLEGRAQRAEKKAQKAADKQPARERPAAAAGATPAQEKRQAARQIKLAAGLDELSLWLADLVRQGLAGVQGKRTGFWDEPARRLIDAQAPGLARRVRLLETLPVSGENWHDAVLDRLARLHLAIEGHRRIESLPPEVQSELRTVVGYPTDLDAVRSGPGLRDTWLVTGQRVEVEDRLRSQRTWLIGKQTGRPALVLEFAHGKQPLDASLAPGMSFDGELAFFPGARALRAVVKLRHSPLEPGRPPRATATVGQAQAAYAEALARSPWLEVYPVVVSEVVLECPGPGWRVRDGENRVLPLTARFAHGWHLLALTGGQPFQVAGELDGTALDPTMAWVAGRCAVIPAPEQAPALAAAPRPVNPPEVAAAWSEASACALVGLGRKPLAVQPTGGGFGQAVKDLDTAEPCARLLGVSALASLFSRVGAVPAADASPRIAVCGPDARPVCPPAAARRLRRLLDGTQPALLPEWLGLLDAAGLRVPHESLADLLARAARQRDLRPRLRPVLDERGRWLAALNPEWRCVGTASEEAEAEAAWQIGTRAERVELVRMLREREPARGRDLVASTWAADPADDRAAFLKELALGLSLDDEPFLEQALDDRSRQVRLEAANLLARLPDSRLCARMQERAAGLVGWDGKTFKLRLPHEVDAGMARDGVEARPPAGLGEKSWWLLQVVAATPLVHWTNLTGTTADRAVQAALGGEWADLLWRAWARAASRTVEPDQAWLLALFNHRPTGTGEFELAVAQVFGRLEPAVGDAILLKLLSANPGPLRPGHPAFELLKQASRPIGPALARALFQRLRAMIVSDDAETQSVRFEYPLFHALDRLGSLLPPELAGELATGWPSDLADQGPLGAAISGCLACLQFRHEMHQELAP